MPENLTDTLGKAVVRRLAENAIEEMQRTVEGVEIPDADAIGNAEGVIEQTFAPVAEAITDFEHNENYWRKRGRGEIPDLVDTEDGKMYCRAFAESLAMALAKLRDRAAGPAPESVVGVLLDHKFVLRAPNQVCTCGYNAPKQEWPLLPQWAAHLADELAKAGVLRGEPVPIALGEKFMTDAEWASLSAESRHKINVTFAQLQRPTTGEKELVEELAKALYTHDTMEEIRLHGPKQYAAWPISAHIQPWCQGYYKTSQALLPILRRYLAPAAKVDVHNFQEWFNDYVAELKRLYGENAYELPDRKFAYKVWFAAIANTPYPYAPAASERELLALVAEVPHGSCACYEHDCGSTPHTAECYCNAVCGGKKKAKAKCVRCKLEAALAMPEGGKGPNHGQ